MYSRRRCFNRNSSLLEPLASVHVQPVAKPLSKYSLEKIEFVCEHGKRKQNLLKEQKKKHRTWYSLTNEKWGNTLQEPRMIHITQPE